MRPASIGPNLLIALTRRNTGICIGANGRHVDPLPQVAYADLGETR